MKQRYPVMDFLLKKVKEKRPFLHHVLSLHGEKSLENYIATFYHKPTQSMDDPLDLVNVVSNETERLLGKETAQKISKRLRLNASIFTGHHHGIDFLPMGIQASILSSLSETKDSLIPILSCTNIPLDNSDKAIGITVDPKTRINLFSNKFAHQLVAAVHPMSEAMVENAKNLACQKIKQEKTKSLLIDLLQNDYRSSSVLSQSSFLDQAVILNTKIWKRMFSAQEIGQSWPEIVTLPLEKIVIKILEKDLLNPKSLIYSILFNDTLRNLLIVNLQDVPGCWNQEILQIALTLKPDASSAFQQCLLKGKSVFFWGIDEDRAPFRYALVGEGNKFVLQPVTKIDKAYKKINWEPHEILQSLQDGSLIPGLFISFVVLSFARGFACCGGFMQTDYLSKMKECLIKCLINASLHHLVPYITNVSTINYAYGPIFAMTRDETSLKLRPAGTIDIIKGGGITPEHIKTVKQISLNEATYSGIIEMYQTVCGNNSEDLSLLEQAKQELDLLLSNSLVII